MPADSIVDGLITDLLSILCNLNELLLRFHVGWGGGGGGALMVSNLALLLVIF